MKVRLSRRSERARTVASTVPMATSLEGLRDIVAAQRTAERNYMMMETAVYTRQFLHAQALKEQGAFGRIQFLRGAHYQDMEAWPPYWDGLPPMWYATHAVSPLLAIANTARSRCTASVRVACARNCADLTAIPGQWKRPSSSWTPSLSAEVTRTFFHCARPYMESFVIYGENAVYEWQMEVDDPVLFRMDAVQPGKRRTEKIEKPGAAGPGRSAAGGNRQIHPALCIQQRRKTPLLRARRRASRLAPAPGARIRAQHHRTAPPAIDAVTAANGRPPGFAPTSPRCWAAQKSKCHPS